MTPGTRVMCTWPIRRVGTVVRVEPSGALLLSSEKRLPVCDPAYCSVYFDPVVRVGDLVRELAGSQVHTPCYRVAWLGERMVGLEHVSGGSSQYVWRGDLLHRDLVWRFEVVCD